MKWLIPSDFKSDDGKISQDKCTASYFVERNESLNASTDPNLYLGGLGGGGGDGNCILTDGGLGTDGTRITTEGGLGAVG